MNTHIKYIVRAGTLAIFMLSLLMPLPAPAQFMRIQLVIDEEISISDVRTLETGQIPLNFGWFHIDLNDDYAGRFTIRTSENINLLVSVQAPDELVLNANNTLPFQLEAAYLNTGNRNLRQAVAFDNKQAFFPIINNGLLIENMSSQQLPLEASMFFYGSVHVGQVDPGVYSGEVVVTINY